MTGHHHADACTWHRRIQMYPGGLWGIMGKAISCPPPLSGSLSVWRSCIQNYHPSGRSDAKGWGSAPGPTNKGSVVRNPWSRAWAGSVSLHGHIQGERHRCSSVIQNKRGRRHAELKHVWKVLRSIDLMMQTQSLTSLTPVNLQAGWGRLRRFSLCELAVCSQLPYQFA